MITILINIIQRHRSKVSIVIVATILSKLLLSNNNFINGILFPVIRDSPKSTQEKSQRKPNRYHQEDAYPTEDAKVSKLQPLNVALLNSPKTVINQPLLILII